MRSISASDLHKILVLSSSLPPYIHHMFSLFNTSDHFVTFSPFSKDFLSNALNSSDDFILKSLNQKINP
mgnify:CR=1 FL=1|jgi:hypothetical protein